MAHPAPPAPHFVATDPPPVVDAAENPGPETKRCASRRHPAYEALTPIRKGITLAVSPIVVRSALDEVIRLTATLPDPHESLLYVKAVPVDAMQRAGGSRPLDGLPFRLEAVLDDWDGGTPRTRASIASWAATWAASWCRWRHEDPGVRPDGNALAWLADNLEWAQENWPAMDEFAEELGEVRRRLREAHGLDPISSGRPCPVCDGTLVHEVTDDGVRPDYVCPRCGGVHTEQGLAKLARLRLCSADANLTRRDVARILDVSAARIRKWIHRGQIVEADGRISLAEARRLRDASSSAHRP